MPFDFLRNMKITNDLEDFEDEGNFYFFKRKLKDLKKRIKSINFLITSLEGQKDELTLKKLDYLLEISKHLKEIESDSDII